MMTETMSITILGYPAAPSRLHSAVAVAASALSRSLAGDLTRTLAFSLPGLLITLLAGLQLGTINKRRYTGLLG